MTNKKIEARLPSSRLGLLLYFWAFQVQLLHKCYASEAYWNQTQRAYQRLRKELQKRRWYQRVARHTEDSRVFFQKAKREADWLGSWPRSDDLPNCSTRTVKQLIAEISQNPHNLLHPELFLPERFADTIADEVLFKAFLKGLKQIRSGRRGEESLPEHLSIEAQDLKDFLAGNPLLSPAKMAAKVFRPYSLPGTDQAHKTQFQEYVINARADYTPLMEWLRPIISNTTR